MDGKRVVDSMSEKILELQEDVKQLKQERDTLQKIAARRAERLESAGLHPDCTTIEAAKVKVVVDAAVEWASHYQNPTGEMYEMANHRAYLLVAVRSLQEEVDDRPPWGSFK